MVTIRPATGVKIATQVKKAGEEVKATLPSVEKECTKLPSFQAPIIKNTRFDKVIVEGNIKERIEKLNILDGDKELDKLLKQYRADVDKCKLASSYKEYRRSVNLVEKKWHSLFEKISSLSGKLNDNFCFAFELYLKQNPPLSSLDKIPIKSLFKNTFNEFFT